MLLHYTRPIPPETKQKTYLHFGKLTCDLVHIHKLPYDDHLGTVAGVLGVTHYGRDLVDGRANSLHARTVLAHEASVTYTYTWLKEKYILKL